MDTIEYTLQLVRSMVEKKLSTNARFSMLQYQIDKEAYFPRSVASALKDKKQLKLARNHAQVSEEICRCLYEDLWNDYVIGFQRWIVKKLRMYFYSHNSNFSL